LSDIINGNSIDVDSINIILLLYNNNRCIFKLNKGIYYISIVWATWTSHHIIIYYRRGVTFGTLETAVTFGLEPPPPSHSYLPFASWKPYPFIHSCKHHARKYCRPHIAI